MEIIVYEKSSGCIYPALEKAFAVSLPGAVLFKKPQHSGSLPAYEPEGPFFRAPEAGRKKYDIAVFAPLASSGFSPRGVDAKAYIIYGEDAREFSGTRGGYILTYGGSARDTLTYSSLDDGIIVVCVSREFKTFGGDLVIAQELPCRAGEKAEPSDTLALTLCMLYAGIKP